MSYFTIKRSFFLVSSSRCDEEFQKIDKFMELLEKSGVGKIIESVKSNEIQCKGRKGYYKYNLFAMIIYCFAKFKASLRNIEDKCVFDLRVLYIMEGTGTLIKKDETIEFKAGDVILVEKGEAYRWNANCKVLISCAPAWYPGQHKLID